MGAGRIRQALAPPAEKVAASGAAVVWVCEPMPDVLDTGDEKIEAKDRFKRTSITYSRSLITKSRASVTCPKINTPSDRFEQLAAFSIRMLVIRQSSPPGAGYGALGG